ncbi:DUF4252 domain-containing protein [Marivirga arenosa]|uniref:DUF4252 domain-containing protein n=1 Tax=Marivirga arenosa TaxID=3059076 RepID=A0AA49GEA7_9BACT|nr:DUF4252 domain-containing protein [Marivirga sp. ABR2-2]WKK85362.1 DUF4252 domain-containing protein [Marivirga sp. ABR2-2]
MKKIGLIVVLALVSLAAQAQNSEFMKFYDKYASNESFTIVSVNQRMIELFSNFEVEGEDGEAMKKAVSGLKGIKLIANSKTSDGASLFSEANKAFARGYDELMTVRDGDSDIRFLIQEKGGMVSELVMLVGSDSSFVAASIFGDIDLKQMSKMANGLNISGMENLEKLEEMDENNK